MHVYSIGMHVQARLVHKSPTLSPVLDGHTYSTRLYQLYDLLSYLELLTCVSCITTLPTKKKVYIRRIPVVCVCVCRLLRTAACSRINEVQVKVSIRF